MKSLLQPLTLDGVDSRTDYLHLENGDDINDLQNLVVTMKRRVVMDLPTRERGSSFLWDGVSCFW